MGQREREQFRRPFLTDVDRIARFLWLHPKTIHLQKQHTDADIQNALASFPKDLESVYADILKSIDELPGPRSTRVQRVLRWVIYSKYPLTLTQLSEAVIIGDMAETWDDNRRINVPTALIDDSFDLVFRKGNPWRSPDAVVQITHKSLVAFLSCSPEFLLVDLPLTGHSVPQVAEESM
jgi:hypothetical protein